MKVGNLIQLLQQFPADLRVYFCPDEAQLNVVLPATVAAKMVQPHRKVMADESDPAKTISHEFIHAVVMIAESDE